MMKRYTTYLSILAVMLLMAPMAQARTVYIDVNAIKGDLTEGLRNRCKQVAAKDTAVLAFGAGTYTINGTIQCWCNAVIKGQGRDKTTVILDKGTDRNGFKAFMDDTFFKVIGTPQKPVSFSMYDITLKLKDHKGIWWSGARCHAVKVYHADPVNIHHVDSYMQNAIITNIDLQVCSNVTVTDCIISNYNNCTDGGNLWLRGDMHNVVIKRNTFYKYGKDEALAFFSRLVKADGHVLGNVTRSNIFVEDNEFFYGGYNGKDKDPKSINHMVFSFFTDQKKSNQSCKTTNFHLKNNTFHINDVCTRCMYISFDPADSHEGFYIENNTIENGFVKSNEPYYRQDIEVNDLSNSRDTIRIVNNKVKNKNVVLTKSGSHAYSFLLVQGGNVDMRGNQIVNEATVNPINGKSTGVQLVWCGAEGGTVTMRDNVCKGIQYISTVGAGDGTKKFTLNAYNNYFEGDTRIYCHKIDDLDLNFTGNTLVSNDMNFFLQEFAPKGTLVFNYNKVTVKPGGGQLMTHWSKTSTNSMKFNRLEVIGNVFKGVKNEQVMLKNFTNTRKRKVSSNKFSY